MQAKSFLWFDKVNASTPLRGWRRLLCQTTSICLLLQDDLEAGGAVFVAAHVHYRAATAFVAGEVGVGGRPADIRAGVDARRKRLRRVWQGRAAGEERVGDDVARARDGVLRQRVVDGERAAERVQRPAAAPEDGVADRQRPTRLDIFSLGFSTPDVVYFYYLT